MPALKDLFRTQKLPTKNNKVGAEVYAVRNSKDIPISTANGLLNATVFPIVQKTLRSSGLLTARTKENLVESELVGLRAIRGLASPVIYGTSLIRFKRKTTNAVEVMKNATAGGSEGSNFVLGSTVAKLQDKALELASRIGIEFPENLIPTKVSEKPAFAKKKVKDTMKILKELKDGSAGTLLGRFVAESAQGTPNQIGRQLLGTAINLAKDEIRRSLTSSFTLPTAPTIGNTGNPVIEQTIRLRDYTPKPYDNGRDKYTQRVSRRGNIEFDGISGILSGLQRNDGNYTDFISQKKQYDISNFANPDSFNPGGVAKKFLKDPQKALNDLAAGAADSVTAPINVTQNIPARPTKAQKEIRGYAGMGSRERRNSLEDKLKIRNGSDRLNQAPTWYSVDGTPPPLGNDKTLDDFDLVPFRFWSISKKTGVSFRATISGLSETVSPSWNASKFIGNPYNFYTYEGVERSVSFTFKLYALNGGELKRMWEKLSFLNTFAYPQQYAAPYVTPPFMKFTLGNMYKDKEGFVESLTISIDDNTPWETGIPHINSSGLPYFDDALVDYKLPTIIEVQMTVKFVESQSTYWGDVSGSLTPKRVYYYGVNRAVQTQSEINGNMLPDGSSPGGLVIPTPPDPRAESFDDGINTDILITAKKELIYGRDIPEVQYVIPRPSVFPIPQQQQKLEAKKAGNSIFKKLFGKK